MCNKGAYSMIAKIYATNNNQIGAYANVLIAMELDEITSEDELFIQVTQQCKRTHFPTKIYSNIYNSIDNFLYKDSILILKPGTYTNMTSIDKKNIMIIGIGKVITKYPILFNLAVNLLLCVDSKLVLYNIHVECTQGHSLFLKSSQAFVDSCQFTKCSGSHPPICADGCKSFLFMNKCVVANSRSSGGILLDIDSKGIIKNCEMHNIEMCAIEVRYGSSLYAERNNFHHNKEAVLAWLDANEVKLIDNIIHNNRETGISISGNREPALSKEYRKLSPSVIERNPPPASSYTKPSQTVVVLQKNQILKNGSFGIITDFQANVRMEENKIAANSNSGCIIKGGVDASLLNNIIHHNGSYGIEIGINYQGKVVVENNHIHSNKKENISPSFNMKNEAKKFGVNVAASYSSQNGQQ